MNSISTFTGKLLFFIRAMEKDGLITKKQQGRLKDMLFEKPQSIMAAYEEYLNDGTELTLKGQLIKIVKMEKQTDSCDGSSSNSRISRYGGMSVKIPKRNLQKLPPEMERL